ncbi:hypothetical protein EMA8858_01326 [Emticicia aquatica]|jgi:uncharacterized membrane protein|uniref:DUF3098 domain-containing protein n=1 Tax=Emticicia aquatica TaxID=1681835 RepID=A0ABN8EQL9_9BACT|nr:DUF3098 domain-containing protein [Emticicia aquatica]CAH0995206.1 hypothetical protein EMA8858_01326 [Emticicia aquatica]
MKNTANSPVEIKENDNQKALPFGKSNYTLMIIGLALLFLGYFVMTLDKEEFGFGFLGITLGPILAFIGFLFQFYPIFKKK